MIPPNALLLFRISLILQAVTSSSSSIRRRPKFERILGALGNNPYDDHFIWLWDHNHLSYYPSDRMGSAAGADSPLSPPPPSSSQTNPSSSENSNTNNNDNNSGYGYDNGHDNNNSNYDNSSSDNSNGKNNNDAPSSSSPNSPTILIVQDASPGPDEEVLYVTSKVNRAYAKRWGFDYLHFTGIAVGGSYSWQATFNKPYLLQKLIQARIENAKPENQVCTSDSTSNSTTGTPSTPCVKQHTVPSYDIVMFLDSSAIIVQLDFNVISLIQSDKMMATSTSKIIDVSSNNNADVVLWNLNHPQTAHISNQWIQQCYLNSSTLRSLLYKSQSETLLSKILQSDKMDNTSNINDNNNNSNDNNNNNASGRNNNGVATIDIIEIIPSPMVDGLQGTLVKQDMSYNDYLIDVSDLRKIMPIVTGIADSVCYRFYPQCEIV